MQHLDKKILYPQIAEFVTQFSKLHNTELAKKFDKIEITDLSYYNFSDMMSLIEAGNLHLLDKI